MPTTRERTRPLVPLHAPELRAPRPPVEHATPARRARFTPDELRAVLEHYSLPPHQSARDLPRGCEGSPKALITTSEASFVLKRWTSGQDDPARVAGAHAVQLTAHVHGAPVAELVPTRCGSSLLLLGGLAYELALFVPGSACPRDVSGARAAGEALARLHTALAHHRPNWRVPDSRLSSRDASERALAGLDARIGAEPIRQIRVALDATEPAIRALAGAPHGVLHGDAHPGNMLAQAPDGRTRVVAILDFANTRRGPHIEELAQAASHWSMRPPADDPSGSHPDSWPAEPDPTVIEELIATYAARRNIMITDIEHAALRPLMARSILIEAAGLPDAPSPLGPGRSIALALARKALWLLENPRSDHKR